MRPAPDHQHHSPARPLGHQNRRPRARQPVPPTTATHVPPAKQHMAGPADQLMTVQPINSWPVPIDAPACRSAILLEPVSSQA